MNPPTSLSALPPLSLQKADRIGVAASVLCAIHCALAPVLIIALPAFGHVWAHPASHILVALLVVPLAIFSIRKGYQTHKKRWILVIAGIGISSLFVGAALPAFSKTTASHQLSSPPPEAAETCELNCAATDAGASETTGCVDACCPSLQVDDSGQTTLHIPPAAIVTTIGGLFLIAAHTGNLCACGHACRTSACSDCKPT